MQRNEPPSRQADAFSARSAPSDRPKEDQPVDEIGTTAGKAPGGGHLAKLTQARFLTMTKQRRRAGRRGAKRKSQARILLRSH